MRYRSRFITLFMLGGGAVLSGLPGCNNPLLLTPSKRSSPGAIKVVVSTTGGDLDLDGYAITVDGVATRQVSWNRVEVVSGLADGLHTVGLTGVANNCGATPAGSISVSVARGDTTRVAFAVACAITGVEVTATTTGLDFDPDGYLISVDDQSPSVLPPNGVLTISRLSAGTHQVTVTGVSPNCSIDAPNPLSVSVPDRSMVQLSVTATCVATSGSVVITAATTGNDPDPNGYSVQLDDQVRSLGVNGSISFDGVPVGDHQVGIADLASNCAAQDATTRTVHLSGGSTTRDTVSVAFAVSCTPTTGSILVTAATQGVALDPDGYQVRVDGLASWALPPNGATTIGHLVAGTHTVLIEGVAANCTVSGTRERSVPVTIGGTTPVTFSVICAQPGAIEVTVVTDGADPDPNGYRFHVELGTWTLPANGVVLLSPIADGNRAVWLDDIAPNCVVIGENSRIVQVTSGGPSTRVAFQLSCVKTSKIALQRGQTITVVYADGSTAVDLAPGVEPAWSPDGGRIVFGAITCFDEYHCNQSGLALMHPNGTGLVQLTTDGSDSEPAWRPGSSQIAFTRGTGSSRRLFLINDNGTGLSGLSLPGVQSAYAPAWSPDGSRLAFTCRMPPGDTDVCVVNADGTGFLRLTAYQGEDSSPAWKPDGSLIAFTTQRFTGNLEMALMAPDGSGVIRVMAGGANQPAWSPDGSKLVFTSIECDYYYGCYSSGLFVVHPDGTGLVRLTTGGDYAPAWRP
jgi:Tol biopolymer transport system component